MATLESPPQLQQRIDVETAARAARTYFQKIYPATKLFSIEEIEMTEDERYWLITLGFEPSRKDKDAAGMEFQPIPKTRYKVFKIDARTGKVVSMKIRSLG